MGFLRVAYVMTVVLPGSQFQLQTFMSFFVLIPTLWLVYRRKGIVYFRYFFSPVLRVASVLFMMAEVERDEVEFACGMLFVLLLIEGITIIRNLRLELIYVSLHLIGTLWWVSTLGSTISWYVKSVVPIVMMSLGCSWCFLSRYQMETVMFEMRYRNSDLQVLISRLTVGVVVVSQLKVLIINEKGQQVLESIEGKHPRIRKR